MDLRYSKYFESMLLFFKHNQEDDIFKSIKPVLNSPSDFYYNYECDNKQKRAINLFEHMFNQYANVDLGGQHYKAIWHVVHTIPLFVKPTIENSKFAKFFYEDFILEQIQCLNCITHYVTTIVNNSIMFENSERTFDEFVGLHNIINHSRYKPEKDASTFKEALRNELVTLYPNIMMTLG